MIGTPIPSGQWPFFVGGMAYRSTEESAFSFWRCFQVQVVGMMSKWLEIDRGWLMSHAPCLLGKRKGRYKLLVGGLEHVLFSIIYGIILPIDFHIFQRGRSTTNQTSSSWKSAHLWAMASLAVSAGPSLHVPWQNCFEGPGRVYTSDEDLGVPKMGVPQ